MYKAEFAMTLCSLSPSESETLET